MKRWNRQIARLRSPRHRVVTASSMLRRELHPVQPPFLENQYLACRYHSIIGGIYRRKRNKENATKHSEAALGIASAHVGTMRCLGFTASWRGCFPGKASLTTLLLTPNWPSPMWGMMDATVPLGWYYKHTSGIFKTGSKRRSPSVRAVDVFERFGATVDAETYRKILSLSGRK